MEINQIVNKAHQIAVSKGWWEEERSPLEVYMLIVSEIVEATEAYRNQEPDVEAGVLKNQHGDKFTKVLSAELIELADAVIRIADYCGRKNWDLDVAIKYKMEINKNRPYRHGNKKA